MARTAKGVLKVVARAAARIAIVFLVALMAAHLAEPRPLFSAPTSAVILDENGALLSARIASDGQWRFAASDTVPRKFERCILIYEDRKFNYHWGVDPMAMARAAIRNIRAGHVVEGGSTLTMQIARMADGNRRRTWWQKIVETLWAIDIETAHSKSEILAIYSANAPFGGNVVGLEAASWRYFGRQASDLSWAECALLAVLPNSPSRIHVSRNRPLLLAKRDRLLETLREQGDIDSTELALAKSEPLPDRPFPIENRAPQLTQRLMPAGRGGTLVTTIDAALQRQAQAIADSYRSRYAHNHVYDIGILVAEVGTGNIKVYVGNASQESPTSMVDMLRAERSTGSILKPFLYAAMMSAGEITPRCLIADTPLDINGFTPHNFSHSYSGAVGADEAITRSLNVPLVRMLTDHNVGRFMADLRQLGMTTLHYDDDHYGASLILGGAEATLSDICSMYASMARRLNTYNADPRHRALTPTAGIHPLRLTADAPTAPTAAQTSATPLTPAAIWHTFRAMADLARPEEEADWQSFASMRAVAWKTGTSYGSRDAWAVGVTTRHVVGVWVGNATGEGRAGMTGVGFAAPVMFDVFSLLPREGGAEWFEEPLEDEDPLAVCRASGLRASGVCAEVDTLLLPREAGMTGLCHYCRLVHLTADGRWQVNSSCQGTSHMVTRPWFVLPPSMAYYYSRCHADYAPLPPLRSDCADAGGRRLAFIYPVNGQTVIRTRSFDGRLQGVVCEAAAPSDGRLFWHLDGEYVGATEGDHLMAIEPEAGAHTMAIVGESGDRATVRFMVE